MGSTKNDGTAQTDRLFLKEVIPLAKKMHAAGKVFFAQGFDTGADTYYTNRTKTTMSREDFEEPGSDSPETFEQALKDMWKEQGYTELAALAPGMKKLAVAAYSRESEDTEVSPFIYVMF